MAEGSVTVAITTKDRAALTLLAVDSARTSAPEARVLVVDSGSSPENLEHLQAELGSVELHAGTYPNAAAARNAALALVDSEFIGFLDSDDLMRPEKITCLLPLLLHDPKAVLAVGRTVIVHADGTPDPAFTERVGTWYEESERIGTSYPGLCIRSTAFTSATLMRRVALEQVGGYDESLPSMEDWDLYLRLSQIGRIVTARCVTADYRVWAGNVDSTGSAEGVVAVVAKHLADPVDLSAHERRRAECALNMRAAVSFQTLLRGSEARRSLARAARVRPARTLVSRAFWRILASSFVPRRITERRRIASR
jgi:glycosyltransferase involved in cell wall biosynthesis